MSPEVLIFVVSTPYHATPCRACLGLGGFFPPTGSPYVFVYCTECEANGVVYGREVPEVA